LKTPEKGKRSYRWYSLFSILLASFLLYLALRGVDWDAILTLLRRGKIGFLLLGAMIATISFLVRGLRWRLLLSAEKLARFSKVFWAMMLGYLGNNFLPGRAGELVRTVLVSRSEGLSFGFSLATAISERVLDAIALISIGAASILFSKNLPTYLSGLVRSFALIGLIGLSAMIVFYRFRWVIEKWALRLPLPGRVRDRFTTGLNHFFKGLGAFQHPAQAARFVIFTAIIWFLDAFGCTLVGYAFNLTITIPQSLLFLAALGLSSSLPSTPGYVGIYQFVAVTLLPLFGFLKSEALVFVLATQLINYVTVISLSSMGLWRLGLGAREVRGILSRS
jgi:glycosyltransferase 2 family protein